jgi:hypothetical protein
MKKLQAQEEVLDSSWPRVGVIKTGLRAEYKEYHSLRKRDSVIKHCNKLLVL